MALAERPLSSFDAPSSAAARPGIRWAAAGGAVLLFAVVAITKADSDLWGHLRFGLDLLRSHHLTAADPYSFTQDRSWVNHEWLSELQMGLAYAMAGSFGLSVLKGLLAFATLALIWTSLKGAAFAPRLLAFAFAAASLAPLIRTLRPQLWTCLALAVLCRVLLGRSRRAAWWLPLLFVLWANLHGGWIVGLGILGAWAAVDVVGNRSSLVRWAVIAGACVLATLGTPYGVGLWTFLASTVHMSRNITEWQPLWTSPPDLLPWSVAVAGSAWLLLRASRQRLHLVVVLVVLAYASLRVMRLGPLFEECAVLLLGPAMAHRWPARPMSPARSPREELAAGVAMFLAAAGLSVWLAVTSWPCVAVEGAWVPDQAASRLLDSAQPGRLVVFFDWGEYALWHWGPRLRVSMDGRRETIYSDARIAGHQAILSGTPEGLATLEAWRPEYVWLPATSVSTKQWLAGHGYRIELDDARSFVAVRADLPPLETAPARVSRGAHACFPA